MNHQDSSNENHMHLPELLSSPVICPSNIIATNERNLNYPFVDQIKTITNLPLKKQKRPEVRKITLYTPKVTYPITSLFNSGNKATEIDNSQNIEEIKIQIPQPEQPTLILKEYNFYQNFLMNEGSVHHKPLLSTEEKEPVVRSKSGDFSLRPMEIAPKKKSSSKRKYMEPVRLHSPKHMFPNRPYVPYDEIIGYVDDVPYDHFGFREDRKNVENDDPNNKIIELMNRIQSMTLHSHEEEEKEISRKFEIVNENPVNILLINQKKFTNNDQGLEKTPKIQLNNNLFNTIILPAPIVRNPPRHIFLQKILKKDMKKLKKIIQTSSKLMTCWNRLKNFKRSNITEWSMFAQIAAEIWPKLYKETEADRNYEKVDVKKMIEKYHFIFLSIEEIEFRYYSELLNIRYNQNSLAIFNYNPRAILE